MFTSIEHFQRAFDAQREATDKILAALTDASLGQTVAEGHRALGGMAWHVVTSMPEMMSRTGLALASVNPESMPPAAAAEILAGYRAASGELAAAVKASWDDAALAVEDDMYGQKWARGLTLSILLNHEIHHRGQMTVLMRQAGLKVPGVFGPALEEWDAYGMDAPPY